MRLLKICLVGLLLWRFVALSPQPARACTPPAEGLPAYDVAAHFEEAEYVFLGTVSKVSNSSSTAVIAVTQYYKGSAGATLEVSGFGAPAECLTQVQPGQRAIFFAEKSGRRWQAVYNAQQATLPADPAYLDYLPKLSGTLPRIPMQPTAIPTPSDAQSWQIGLLAVSSLSGLCMFGLLALAVFFWLYLQRTAPKIPPSRRFVGDTEENSPITRK